MLEIDPKSGTVLTPPRIAPIAFVFVIAACCFVSGRRETVAVAAQDQDLSETRPLVALLRLGKDLEPLPMPDVRDADFRGYIGSIAFDARGDFVAAASPRGSIFGIWSASGRGAARCRSADVCGVAAGVEPNTFWASSGHGGIYKIQAATIGSRIVAHWQSDAGFDQSSSPDLIA
ncbi:MAG: DUF1513 domain-containing protein [Rhizomicrobium sp.]